MSKDILFENVAFIGLGLIGSSLARALKEKGLCSTIAGNSQSQTTMDKALALGVVDSVTSDLEELVRDSDLIVLALPISYTQECLQKIKPALKEGVIITDVGSVKEEIQNAVDAVLGDDFTHFVAGHPIAGSEQSGVEAGKSDLYKNHKVILTPVEQTDKDAIAKIQSMWEKVGAEVLFLNNVQHDRILASTSHLPHLLAYALVDTLASAKDNQEIFRYSAGGFRDFTRIASSDPKMWRDIFLNNKKATLAALDDYIHSLENLKSAISKDDADSLMGTFTRAKSARDHFVAMNSKKSYQDVEEKPKESFTTFHVNPGGAIKGSFKVPGDKSISHRSIVFSAIANGVSEIRGFLEGEDSLATLQAFRDMGVVIEGPEQGKVTVHGVGLNGLKEPPGPIYLGNSGTSMRLLMGLLAGQKFDTELTGDESLSKRPMERVANPLRKIGAKLETQNGNAPIKVFGNQKLQGAVHDLEVVSAQVKSALMLAGLYAEGKTQINELDITRDHSERMLNGFDYPVETDGLKVILNGKGSLSAKNIQVPGDISSAAFFMVAALITPNSEILIQHVGVNPSRIGVINILRAMGGNIKLLNKTIVGGEPVADIKVVSSDLQGIDIPVDQVSLAIDEFPAIFIAASCAKGTTRLSNAEELRVKESDRISSMANGLTKLGINNTVKKDGIDIEGGRILGGEVESYGDHRIAMSFAVAALRSEGTITINDCENVATSFPNFVHLAHEVGLGIREG